MEIAEVQFQVDIMDQVPKFNSFSWSISIELVNPAINYNHYYNSKRKEIHKYYIFHSKNIHRLLNKITWCHKEDTVT